MRRYAAGLVHRLSRRLQADDDRHLRGAAAAAVHEARPRSARRDRRSSTWIEKEKTHVRDRQTAAWQERAGSFGDRPRLHGHERILRRRQTSRNRSRRSTMRSSAGSPSSTPPTCTASAGTRSWSARRSATAATRCSWRPSSATCAGRTASSSGVQGDPDYVRSACEASLKRLGVEIIDLYYQHRVDPNVPIEDTVGEMARLKEEGKIRFLGLSEAAPRDDPRGPCDRTDHRGPDRAVAVEPRCRSRGAADGARARHRLCRLFAARPRLPDRPVQVARRFPRRRLPQQPPALPGREFRRRTSQLVDEVEAMAREKGCTTAQLALAWVLAQGEDIVPIPGTKHVRYLDENIGALEVKLSDGGPASGSTRSCRRAPRRASATTPRHGRRSTARARGRPCRP